MTTINFIIALVTNIGALCLFLICVFWWWKLLKSEAADFGWWFFGTAFLACPIFWWTMKGMHLALDPLRGLPYDTLYERLGMMIGVWVKLWVATRRKPMPRWTLRRRADDA